MSCKWLSIIDRGNEIANVTCFSAHSEENNPNTEEFARFVRMLRKAAMQFGAC